MPGHQEGQAQALCRDRPSAPWAPSAPGPIRRPQALTCARWGGPGRPGPPSAPEPRAYGTSPVRSEAAASEQRSIPSRVCVRPSVHVAVTLYLELHFVPALLPSPVSRAFPRRSSPQCCSGPLVLATGSPTERRRRAGPRGSLCAFQHLVQPTLTRLTPPSPVAMEPARIS